MLQWKTLTFEQLDTHLLYQILKLRIDVFVVEQKCPYPELDNKDTQQGVRYLLGFIDNELATVARLLPAGTTYPNVSIGRVAVARKWRERKIGRALMEKAISECEKLWPKQEITISAQNHLKTFYTKHGFERCSEVYLEDGIPHIDMHRKV